MNTVGILVILGVFAYLLLPNFTRIDDIHIAVEPESLPPDGRSEAVITVTALNSFGWELGNEHAVEFGITEGGQSGELVEIEANTARLRAGTIAGHVHVRIRVEGVLMPYEVVIRVGRQYSMLPGQQNGIVSLFR